MIYQKERLFKVTSSQLWVSKFEQCSPSGKPRLRLIGVSPYILSIIGELCFKFLEFLSSISGFDLCGLT